MDLEWKGYVNTLKEEEKIEEGTAAGLSNSILNPDSLPKPKQVKVLPRFIQWMDSLKGFFTSLEAPSWTICTSIIHASTMDSGSGIKYRIGSRGKDSKDKEKESNLAKFSSASYYPHQ